MRKGEDGGLAHNCYSDSHPPFLQLSKYSPNLDFRDCLDGYYVVSTSQAAGCLLWILWGKDLLGSN